MSLDLRVARKTPDLADLLTREALQPLACLLLAGNEWNFFEVPLGQLLLA